MSDQQAATETVETVAAPVAEAPPQSPVILSRVDEVLDKALADAGIEAEDGEGGAKRDASGRFVKKAESKTQDAGEGKEAPAASSKHSDDDIRSATAALQRDKAPKWMLDKRTAGDDEAIAYALKSPVDEVRAIAQKIRSAL